MLFAGPRVPDGKNVFSFVQILPLQKLPNRRLIDRGLGDKVIGVRDSSCLTRSASARSDPKNFCLGQGLAHLRGLHQAKRSGLCSRNTGNPRNGNTKWINLQRLPIIREYSPHCFKSIYKYLVKSKISLSSVVVTSSYIVCLRIW
jgi:hypothetical protein